MMIIEEEEKKDYDDWYKRVRRKGYSSSYIFATRSIAIKWIKRLSKQNYLL